MAGIGWAIARSVTRPLRTLDAAAARFATGDLAPVEPDPSAPPEIAVLGDTMNTMARRLDQLLSEQREFVADASHQLRTPLTALRLRLENLQSAAATAEDEDALGAAIEETNRLDRARGRPPAAGASRGVGRAARRWTSSPSPPTAWTRGRPWPTPPRSGWTSSRPADPSSPRRSPAASSRSWTTSSTTRSRWRRRDRASR